MSRGRRTCRRTTRTACGSRPSSPRSMRRPRVVAPSLDHAALNRARRAAARCAHLLVLRHLFADRAFDRATAAVAALARPASVGAGHPRAPGPLDPLRGPSGTRPLCDARTHGPVGTRLRAGGHRRGRRRRRDPACHGPGDRGRARGGGSVGRPGARLGRTSAVARCPRRHAGPGAPRRRGGSARRAGESGRLRHHRPSRRGSRRPEPHRGLPRPGGRGRRQRGDRER